MSDTNGYKAVAIGLLDWFLRLVISALAVTVITLWRDVAVIQENRFSALDALRQKGEVQEFCRALVEAHDEKKH